MSKEQIICEDCGYEYRGCAAVDFCPRCDEVETDSQQLLAEVEKLKEHISRLEEIDDEDNI